MIRAGVDLELFDHLPAEFVAREHAFNGVFDDKLGFVGTHVFHRDVLVAAHPAGVKHIALVGVLLAGDLDLLRIYNHNEIAGIGMRRVGRLVATTQNIGDLDRNTTEGLIGGVHNVPRFGVVRTG